MTQHENPRWWGSEHDLAWDHVKLAMKRDWEQMRNFMAGKATGDWNTSRDGVRDRQNQPFEEVEAACRFGYGARLEYDACPRWTDDLEIELAEDWQAMNPNRLANWEQARAAVRYGWGYEDERFTSTSGILLGESIELAGSR